MRKILTLLVLLSILLLPAYSQGAVNLWLNFDAQWVNNLSSLATKAGVPDFDNNERAQIETTIRQEFETALTGIDVTVFTADPGGQRERVEYGATTASTNQLGSSQLDFRNASMGRSDVFSANFDFIVEASDNRSEQIHELAIALAGTGVHELGHSFGIRHHAAYGNPSIRPENYSNTQGIQNTHLLATGSTGITELQREQSREFSLWSRVLLDAAANISASPMVLQNEAGDAGQTAATAQWVPLAPQQISQTDAASVFGTLATENDVDLFAFDATGPGLLSAEVWSHGWFAVPDDFDSLIRLLASDGTTVLAENDDIRYLSDLFDAGTTRETDSWLLNIPLEDAGRYYLEISSVGTVTDPVADGFYQVIFAIADVPEPHGLALLLVALGFVIRREYRAADSE